MRISDKNGRWPIPQQSGDPDPHFTHNVEPDPIMLPGHHASDDHGINLPVRVKRGWWFLIAVVVALALAFGFLVLGATS